MRLLMLLCCVWLASAGTVPDECDQVTFDGKYYDRELLTDAGEARWFSYANSINTLFFIHFSGNGSEKDLGGAVVSYRRPRRAAYYNIDTKELKDIPEVGKGSTTAINTDTDEVYLGGDKGIYKFNHQTKKAEPYTAEAVSIYALYFLNNILFYKLAVVPQLYIFPSPKPGSEIYSYDGKETKKFFIPTFFQVIGDTDEYYFTNQSGIFRVLDNKLETAEKFANFYSDTVFARDNNKKIFVGTWSGVYTVNVKDKKLDKVADIKRVSGLKFDKDNNIIYTDHERIYKLTYNKAKCPPA